VSTRAQRFTDKVVLVTGAGSGIGRGSALAFAAEGATVVAVGTTKSTLDETVELIAHQGGTATSVVADVASADEVAEAVAFAVREFGGLHVAHNNAGFFPKPMPLADLPLELWTRAVQVNLTGVLLCMQHEVRHMRDNGGGVIVNTSSNIGAHGRRPGVAAYAAVKAGVSALTRGAALDHIGQGVRINAVSPGATATRMSLRPNETEADRAERLKSSVPIGRVGEVAEVVNAVLWLASDESSFVVGQDVVADGGVTA
jgi:NAD(P)-dependent dehydrogenase (short-subunit alcohol dehydrogenase family)